MWTEPTPLSQAFVLDLLTLAICAVLISRNAQISVFHPATIYFVFHVLSFTWRLVSLISGAERLFSEPGYEVVTDAEYLRAAVVADFALFVMTFAWIKASNDGKEKCAGKISRPASSTRMLSVEAIWLVAVPAFFIGLFGMLYFSVLPGASETRAAGGDLGAWGRSTWVTGTQMWAGVALLILIYRYGFRLWLLIPMVAFLVVMGYQGYHRFRMVLPSLLLLQFYLDRRGQKWPTVLQVVPLILLFLLWFPLKEIGRLAQQGASADQIISRSTDIIEASVQGDNEIVFLDQFASSMTLRDRYGRFFYFETYVPILTLPVPRPLWPEKPAIAFYLDDISTHRRPMAKQGMIVTLFGESYISFGYVGIAVVSYLIAYTMGRLYYAAFSKPRFSIFRLAYLVFSVSMLQVYRDGLPSLIVFTAAAMMPFIFLFVLSSMLKADATQLELWRTRMGIIPYRDIK